MLHTPPQSWPISYYGESATLYFKMGSWKVPWENGDVGYRLNLWQELTEEHRMSRGVAKTATNETARTQGLCWERGSTGRVLTSKARGPQPAVSFRHERKLALEYGWGYFVMIHESFSDDMNPLMRWSCDKIHRKAINFSADDFLEVGEKLFCRKDAGGWLPFRFIFCSGAESCWNQKPDSSCSCTCITVLGKANLGLKVAWDRWEEGCI